MIDHHFCIRRTAHEARTKTLPVCDVCVFKPSSQLLLTLSSLLSVERVLLLLFFFCASPPLNDKLLRLSRSVDSFFFLEVEGKSSSVKENSQFRCETRSESSNRSLIDDASVHRELVLSNANLSSFRENRCKCRREIELFFFNTEIAIYLTRWLVRELTRILSLESHFQLENVITFHDGMWRFNEIKQFFCESHVHLF